MFLKILQVWTVELLYAILAFVKSRTKRKAGAWRAIVVLHARAGQHPSVQEMYRLGRVQLGGSAGRAKKGGEAPGR